ncbi:MAG: phosphotransferase [Pseudomonadota bacterium]
MNQINLPNAQMTEFVKLFIKDIKFSAKGMTLQALPGDGSKRYFWRILLPHQDTSFIAMENPPADAFSIRENVAYLRIGKHLFYKGLPVPEIHRFDLSHGWFVMEDMGDRNLQDQGAQRKNRIPLYEKVVEILFRLQMEGSQGFNPAWCCQTKRYDHDVMRRFESDYFRDSFLVNYLGLKKDWPELESPFNHLAETASKAESHFFLHRDFQSRNIMVSHGRVGILDWQGGRIGPLPYDLASLLIDPYADLSGYEKDQISKCYLKLLRNYDPGFVEPFKKYFPYLAIQRNLQILGAFSYLTKVQMKPYFEAYIPPAIRSLHGLLMEVEDPKLSLLIDPINSLTNIL